MMIRELADQIHHVVRTLFAKQDMSPAGQLTFAVFTGATKISADVQHLEKLFSASPLHIMIGTPGRLLQLIAKQAKLAISLKEMEVLVLDEADRLLDMGFSETLRAIIAKCPKQRRTGLFSATMTDEVEGLVTAGLRHPVKIVVQVKQKASDTTSNSTKRTPDSLTIYHQMLPIQGKLSHLLFLLDREVSLSQAKILVYFPTCAMVDYFQMILERVTSRALFSIHRKLPQKKRQQAFEGFRHAKGAVLLCTDIAARGLDMPDIDWVIQFDPPQDPKAFIHRCGRAGRMGQRGQAIVYITPSEAAYLDFLSVRKVPTLALSMEEADILSPAVLLEKVKVWNAQDQALYFKGIEAFVSYLRFYQEHQAKYIFQLKKMDMLGLVELFGLAQVMDTLEKGWMPVTAACV